jgi:hypothetical protein
MRFWKFLKSKYYIIILLIALAVYTGILLIISSYFSDAWAILPHWLCIVSLMFFIFIYIFLILFYTYIFNNFIENYVMSNIENNFVEIYTNDIQNYFEIDCYKAATTNNDLAEIEKNLKKDSVIWIISKSLKNFDLEGGILYDSIQKNLKKGIEYTYFFLDENFHIDERQLLNAHKKQIKITKGKIQCCPLPEEFFLIVPYDLTIYNPDKCVLGGRVGYIGIEAEEDFNVKVHDDFIDGIYKHLVKILTAYNNKSEG